MLLTLPDFLDAVASLADGHQESLARDTTWRIALADGRRIAVVLSPFWHGERLIGASVSLGGSTRGALLRILEDKLGPPTRRIPRLEGTADNDEGDLEVHWHRDTSPIFVSAEIRPGADEEVIGLAFGCDDPFLRSGPDR